MFFSVPFYCTNGGGVMTALTTCMQQAGEDLNSIFSKTDQGSTGGQIDPTSNLQNDKVYVFAGTADRTVAPGMHLNVDNSDIHVSVIQGKNFNGKKKKQKTIMISICNDCLHKSQT